MSKTYWEAVKGRRSIRLIGDEVIVPEERVEEIVRDALTHVPSAFNCQGTRLVLLFGGAHKKLWSLTLDALKNVTPAEQFENTKKKINTSFASGYGTILFYEDQSVVERLMSSFPIYAKNFPVWSEHTNGMHQFAIWTALSAEGLGVSLQHYNPLIDEAIAKEWTLPASWKLIAQMPFGAPLTVPDNKQYLPLEDRLKVVR
ncbi:MAG: nitroreductase family protein [Bacillota bacterium]